MAFRSSASDLGRFRDNDSNDNYRPQRQRDGGGGGGGRWDRDRLERAGRGVAVDERAQPNKYEERRRYLEEDRYYEREDSGSRRRSDLFEEQPAAEVAGKAMTPYRRRSIVEQDRVATVARPQRPQYIRRQSSLDTFDRRPMPRYGDREHSRDSYRPPTNVPIPLPVRSRAEPQRRFHEEVHEEIRYRDDGPGREDESYQGSKARRGRAGTMPRHGRRRASSSSDETVVSRSGLKRGKTRMPKGLIHRRAIIDLGYPFEEEEEYYIVKHALAKEQIDEVIRISESYRDGRENYRFEETTITETDMVPAPMPPPAPASVAHSDIGLAAEASQQQAEFVERRYIKEYYPPRGVAPLPGPLPTALVAPTAAAAAGGGGGHHSAEPQHEIIRERYISERDKFISSDNVGMRSGHGGRDDSSAHGASGGHEGGRSSGGALALAKTAHAHRSDREIKAEIRALEAEQRALKLERDAENKLMLAERVREGGGEMVPYNESEHKGGHHHKGSERDVYRVEKDRKVNPKLVAALMATLT